ncbi:MAG: DUF445 family protein, partial [Victivallaceae bacterium]|nr:DUF445 family protein [Victivallaceae bacterium]
MRIINRAVSAVSWCILAVVAALAVAKYCGVEAVVFSGAAAFAFTVLTAAAVGYVTNQLAVFLLFRPYDAHWGVQGLVPRKKSRLARALGEMIPAYLLDPGAITDELAAMVRNTLDKPELLDELRTLICRFADRYSLEFAGFLSPHIVRAAERAVADNLSPETLRRFFDTAAGSYLGDRANREQLAAGVIDELKRRAPEFSAFIRSEVRSGAADYVRTRHPRLAAFFSA